MHWHGWFQLQISLEKVDRTWWDSLLKNEEKIDLKKLEVTKAFDELDPEEQMKIRQLQQESVDKLKGKMDNKKQVKWCALGYHRIM